MTEPKIGATNWKQARATTAYHLAEITNLVVLIRQAGHLEVAKEIANDISTSANAALANFNLLVTIIEVNQNNGEETET